MAIYQTYSKRRRAEENADLQDVYQYLEAPYAFRVQVAYIWRDIIGDGDLGNHRKWVWDSISDILRRENGLHSLSGNGHDTLDECEGFLLHGSMDNVLDIIQLSFAIAHEHRRRSGLSLSTIRLVNIAEGAKELNTRFREHGLGYQLEDDRIVRVDSMHLHKEAVRPVLNLLREEGFEGASAEFAKAFDHHKEGNSKEAINEALKAFESTMKAICDRKGWERAPGATATPLIKAMYDHGLIPDYLQQQFSGVRTALESGLPTTRNKTSAHGQGGAVLEVPSYMASYCLNMAAANMLLMLEAYRSSE